MLKPGEPVVRKGRVGSNPTPGATMLHFSSDELVLKAINFLFKNSKVIAESCERNLSCKISKFLSSELW